MDKYKIIETLNCELKPATGCTEPGAIADCALKVYTSVTAAFQSAFIALRGLKV